SKTVAARMDRAAYADAESLLVLFLLLRLLLRRSEPLEALEQLFFGHAIDRHLGIVGIDGAAGRADKRRRLRLGLVDLDVLLQRVNELLLEVVRGYRSLGDFPQGDDRIFVVVALDGDLRAGRNHSRAVACQQHEIEAVLDLVDAVLDGDTGHERLAPAMEPMKSCR